MSIFEDMIGVQEKLTLSVTLPKAYHTI